MKNRELFDACARQCIWCKEQWPVLATKDSMLHVGPYTRDKSLFFTACKSKSIREAFEYVGYTGCIEIKWRPPSVSKLKAAGWECDSSPDRRRFWCGLNRASLDVAEWPGWKRGLGGEKPTPEYLKRLRDEVRHWDLLEYWARKECTEGLQYRPTIEKGRITEPTCNWGLGCIACWNKHEAFSNKLHEKDCY